jgi:RNA polymerase sigma factor, sigma-70 family
MPTIVGEIKRYFRDKGWVIRVPRRIQENSKKVNNAKYHLTQELGRTPTIKDIADYVELSEEEVLEIMEASKVYTPQSLDQSFENSDSEDKDTNLIDVVGEDDKEYDFIDNQDFIRKTLDKLSEVEKQIILGRYFEQKTQVALAKELNISQMTVSRLEKKALAKFREEMNV